MAEDTILSTTLKLKEIVEDLKKPRSFIRNKAIRELMAIRDESMIPLLFRMIVKETDFVKVQFCRFMAKIKGDLSIPPLIILLLDKSESVAKEASFSLAMIDSDRKSDALILLLRRKVGKFSKSFAIKSLGTEKVIKSVPYLAELLSSDEEEIRQLAIEALRQIGDPAAIQSLIKFLKDKNEKVVYRILLALGEVGDRRVSSDVFDFLTHKNADIRRSAVWALSRLDYGKAMPRLIKMLQSDTNEEVRQEVAKRLGKTGKAAVVKPLIFAKAFDKSHNVRIYSEWALREIPVKEKTPILQKLAGDKGEVIRGEAILEIGKSGDERFLKLLKKALNKDRSEYVRASAAEGLSFIHSAAVKDALKTALKDSENVRNRAADSLFRSASIKDDAMAVDMAKGVFGDHDYVKRTGFKIIEKLYSDRKASELFLESLYNLFKDQNEDIQRSIIKCLGKIGDLPTISFLNEIKTEKLPTNFKEIIEEAIDSIEKKEIRRT